MICRLNFKKLFLALVLGLSGGLMGCSMPDNLPIPASTGEAAAAYQTISVILTQTAAATERAQSVASPQSTLTPSVTIEVQQTPMPPQPSTPDSLRTTSAPPCEIAAAANPLDVSIPDDTQLLPGESFVKTWRLVNNGSCAWTREYKVIFFSGFDMGFKREDNLRQDVNPGESVDISLDMVAPLEPGSYQGNYKLRGKTDQLFGIGPEGSSPFWVRIQVIAVDTPTPTVTQPTTTPTVTVYQSGGAVLSVDQSYDLDRGETGTVEEVDLALRLESDALQWVPANGARVVVQGSSEPDIETCKAAVMSSEPLVLGVELEGSFLCLRTSRGLPAWVYLEHVDPVKPELGIQFVVWSVP